MGHARLPGSQPRRAGAGAARVAPEREGDGLCVTGDGRAFDVRPDVTQVFDLDGTRLVALAAEIGVPAAVPETPSAPPLAVRPERLVQSSSPAPASRC